MRERQGQAIKGFEAAANKLARVSSRTSPIMESLGGFAIAAVVLYSGYTVIMRGNPPGSLFSFITSVIMLYEPMKRVARLHVDLSSSLFGVGMLYDFLDEGDFEEDPPGARDLVVTEGRIEFRNVVFGYRPEERVLHAVSFVAEAGRTMALVGRSGGGKSTVMSLILRLYDVESGQILCDGVDIATVTRRSLRRQIGYVAQENFLFKGSVRDNIALGRPGASEEEIVAAAKAAYAHDFIMSFERGYDTPCGEHGMQLSGGQRQRIAIARAFLKDAPIILLDEATSALELRIRAGDPEGAENPVRGAHDHRHRPPALDRRPGRRDLRHGPRPDRRARAPPRTSGARAHLHPYRPDAVPRQRGLSAP